MTLYIIDSDILVAELLNKYQFDDKTKKVLGYYRRIPLMNRVMTDFVIAEFELYILSAFPAHFPLGVSEKIQLHDVVRTYLRQISNSCTIVSPNNRITKNAFSLYQQSKNGSESGRITFIDSLLLASAIQLQYAIISLDVTIQNYARELHIPYYEVRE